MEIDFIFSRFINQSSVNFLDIGAHKGEFISILKGHTKKHKIIHLCVEPLSQNLRVLRIRKFLELANFRLKIRIAPIAITSTTGTYDFYLGSADTLFTSKREWTEKFPNHFVNSKRISINGLSFREYLNRYEISPEIDIVKIDAEGADLEILNSVVLSGSFVNAIMIEVTNDNYNDIKVTLFNSGFTEIYLFLRIGIPTIYIGEPISLESFNRSTTLFPGLCGNLVAFRSDGFIGQSDSEYRPNPQSSR